MPDKKTIPGGLVIVFEGIDGIGKSTQIELTKKHLEPSGYDVVALRNLGGSPIGEALREVLLSELPRPPLTDMHVSLAVQAALIEVIEQARVDGKIVLMDRGPLSLAAYQIYGTGLTSDLAWTHVDLGVNAMSPELSLLFVGDISASVTRAREASNKPDYFENKPMEYFDRVAQGYIELADKYSMKTINADRGIEEIQREVTGIVDSEIAKHLA